MPEGVFGQHLAMCKRMLLPSGLGFAFGVLMALPRAFPVQLSETPYVVINAPALWLANTWTQDLGLPPRGEFAAWVVVPMAAVVVQWTLLGLLIGLCLCLRSQRTPSAPSGDNQAPMPHEKL